MKPGGAAGKGVSRAARSSAADAPAAARGLTHAPVVLPLALLLLLATRVTLGVMQPLASEDAYITFRYARMLVSGHGLVFNPGEAVMGFTSLPWTLWCALGALLHADLVLWTRATNLVADAATLWLGWRMLEPTHGRVSAGVFAVFFAGWPLFAAGSASGLEVNAFLALGFLAASLVASGSRAAGPVLGLFAIMRPEGLAAALVLGLAARNRARIEALVVVGLTLAALTAFYGSPVPQSVVAKAGLYGTPGPWDGRHWWEWLAPSPVGRFPVATEGQHLLYFSAVFLPAVVAGVRGLAPVWRSAAALAGGAGVVVWLGYVTLGVAFFWWYMVVPLAALSLFAAVGLPGLVRGRGILVALLLAVLGIWSTATRLYVGRSQAEAVAFAPVADYLLSHAKPTDSVLLEPIGLIGDRTGLRVLDETGLVSPEIAARRLRGPGWYADVVQRHQPDWLVARPEALESSIAFAGVGGLFRDSAERDSMLVHYRLERPAQPDAGEALAVYRRAGAGASPAAR